ncbi:hypothetical protein Syun_015044 [Stephania yunnanensis]|uniref:Uncharacterized protein n=1 Tax=Stephania yunnanensis TaxID=152371 RepID=A0AAP0PA68_9MAGN
MRISEIAYQNPSVQTFDQSRSSIVLKSPNQLKTEPILILTSAAPADIDQ